MYAEAALENAAIKDVLVAAVIVALPYVSIRFSSISVHRNNSPIRRSATVDYRRVVTCGR